LLGLVFVRPRLRFNLLPPPPKDKAEEEAAEKEKKAKKVRGGGVGVACVGRGGVELLSLLTFV
jgi:hypothetical protein